MCMADTISLIIGLRRNLSRHLLTNSDFDIVLAIFEMKRGDSLSFQFLKSLDPI